MNNCSVPLVSKFQKACHAQSRKKAQRAANDRSYRSSKVSKQSDINVHICCFLMFWCNNFSTNKNCWQLWTEGWIQHSYDVRESRHSTIDFWPVHPENWTDFQIWKLCQIHFSVNNNKMEKGTRDSCWSLSMSQKKFSGTFPFSAVCLDLRRCQWQFVYLKERTFHQIWEDIWVARRRNTR